MNPRSLRRRGVVLLCLAVACGGLAASQVRGREKQVEAQIGSPVPVLVARRDLEAGTRLTARAAGRSLVLRPVPQRFVPADALSSPDEAVGLRTAAPVAAGSYLTAAHLRIGDGGEPGQATVPGRGQRVIEVGVAGGEALAAAAGPQARVDVLVTTDPGAGAGRTYVALEDVELVGIRPGAGGPPAEGASASASGGAAASLLVTARQAVFLTAAQSFAREIRLLLRPPGDRRRVGPAAVGVGGI